MGSDFEENHARWNTFQIVELKCSLQHALVVDAPTVIALQHVGKRVELLVPGEHGTQRFRVTKVETVRVPRRVVDARGVDESRLMEGAEQLAYVEIKRKIVVSGHKNSTRVFLLSQPAPGTPLAVHLAEAVAYCAVVVRRPRRTCIPGGRRQQPFVYQAGARVPGREQTYG